MTEKNPWQTKSTKVVYENPWIKVSEDNVNRPDGQPGIYGVVHFKNKAIGILPIDAQGNVYLVGQYRYPLKRYSWEIPEGGCPELEDPQTAAKRELSEETGLSAGKWEELCRADLSNSVSDEEAIIFLATELTIGQANPEPTEQLMPRRVSFAEALAMVKRGEILDSMSVIAITYFACFFNNINR